MSTTVYIVRHATGEHIGRYLAGRLPGVSLNDAGRAEGERLAAWLAPVHLDAVYSSPLERARETAAYLAAPRELEVRDAPAFVELDFGEWTGRPIADLHDDEHWRHFNGYRSGTRAPAGETMLEAQARAADALLALARAHPDQSLAVVSHADVIRALVSHLLGAPLDLFLRIEIAPASVTAVRLDPWGPTVLGVNGRPDPVGG